MVGEAVSHASLHAAGELLRGGPGEAAAALAHLQRALAAGADELAELGRALLRRAADAPDPQLRRLALRALLPGEEVGQTLATLRLFLDRLGPAALREDDLAGARGPGASPTRRWRRCWSRSARTGRWRTSATPPTAG